VSRAKGERRRGSMLDLVEFKTPQHF